MTDRESTDNLQMTDLYRIIRELVEERNKLDRIISSLEQMIEADAALPPPVRKRRGRKSMDSAARKEVSERMKRYWAKRRTESKEAKGDESNSAA